MKEISPRIAVDADIRFGKRVIAGTRIAVDVVLGHLWAGDTVETVAAEYRIIREDVLAALSHAAHTVANERGNSPGKYAA